MAKSAHYADQLYMYICRYMLCEVSDVFIKLRGKRNIPCAGYKKALKLKNISNNPWNHIIQEHTNPKEKNTREL